MHSFTYMAMTFLMAFHIAVCTASMLWKTFVVGTVCRNQSSGIQGAIICGTFGLVGMLVATAMFTYVFRELFHLQLAPCLFHILIWLLWLLLLTLYCNILENHIILKSVVDISYVVQWVIMMFCGISSWVLVLKKKERRALLIVVMFLVASAFGVGFCLVWILWMTRRLRVCPKIVWISIGKLALACTVRDGIAFNVCGGGKGISQASASSGGAQHTSGLHCPGGKSKKRLRENDKENESPEGDKNPPKKVCNKQLHDGHSCSDCSVWVATGKDGKLKQFHRLDNVMKHPGDRANEFSVYLTTSTLSVVLKPDSCMCHACYRDCLRKGDRPRWCSLMDRIAQKHCFLCCTGSNCQCRGINEWRNACLVGSNSFHEWMTYFKLKGEQTHVVGNNHDVCKLHYGYIHRVIAERNCKVCRGSNSVVWHLGAYLSEQVRKIDETEHVEGTDWVCSECHGALSYPEGGNKVQLRHKVLRYAEESLKNKGACLVADLVSMYRDELMYSKIDCNVQREMLLLRKFVSNHIDTTYHSYAPSNRSGKMYYNETLISGNAIGFVYNLLVSNHKDMESTVRAMIKRQTSKFPKSREFDYRSLFKDGMVQQGIEKYFDPELIEFLHKVTASDTGGTSSNEQSKVHCEQRKMKLMMASSILSNIMDPRSCFMQTLIGLACYSQGLRDKGFKILNTFGIAASVFHIREHGNFWAHMRKAINEINPTAFWRVTFDNLDFRIKYAKKLVAGGGNALKRMLNLITSQVSFRSQARIPNSAPNSSRGSSPAEASLHVATPLLTEQHFQLKNSDEQWNCFCDATFDAIINNLEVQLSSENAKPLLQHIQSSMNHWTAPKKDTIVYTTVSEAHSSSMHDVGQFLHKLKQDLRIGCEGYPSYVIVGGDQQTYAHMRNLKTKYGEQYSWMYPVPGDWHIMKTSAEVIQIILKDGGFSTCAKQCGHKGEVTQWKDIHNILVALYEALLRVAVHRYRNTHVHGPLKGMDFWEWVCDLHKVSNSQCCQFWSQMLVYLHAYVGFYFAIRSGNWLLRNSCLKVLTELFFSYSRDKYELLSTQALADSLTYPPDVISRFMDGEWTVSIKGRPYHNVALDEAQECVINRNLKQITTRASHFRLVDLADFMAYLEQVMTGLESYIAQYRNVACGRKCSSSCARTCIIYGIIQPMNIFEPDLDRPLCNVFTTCPPQLHPSNITDLLSIKSVGNNRMFTHIKQYILNSQVRQKRRRQKLKTFTPKKETSRQLQNKIQQASLLLSNAYQKLVIPGSGVQTYPFPLALCSPTGGMRPCLKSSFRNVILHLFPNDDIFITSCPVLVQPPTDLEIIVDFLFFLHQPPPPDVITFKELGEYLWNKIVLKLGVSRGAKVLRIIIDKPSYLPAARKLLHASRHKRTGMLDISECTIASESMVPHGKYQQLLANKDLKSKLVTYLVNMFRMKASVDQVCQILIDSECFECPLSLYNGTELAIPTLRNEHGEADYNVWYHSITSLSKNIVVIGSDTDIWMYGMALKEAGWLGEKTVYVERDVNKEYVNIGTLVTVINSHPQLQKLSYPATDLFAVYVLSGCDYVSSFFRTTSQAFATAFIEYALYLCKDNELVQMHEAEGSGGVNGLCFTSINNDTWTKLVCCVYLLKHKILFASERIDALHNTMSLSPLSPDKGRLLKWLGYKKLEPILETRGWHGFTRHVCFKHSSASKDHECLLIPSIGALNYHRLRGEYVIKAAFSCTGKDMNGVNVNAHGWKEVNNEIQIVWDDDCILERFVNKGCGCKGGCDGSKAGCKNCFRMCRPCNLKCKCNEKCNNPHNNGGSCPNCVENNVGVNGTEGRRDNEVMIEELVDGAEEEGEDGEEIEDDDVEFDGLLPVPTPNEQSEIDMGSDSDSDSDGDE